MQFTTIFTLIASVAMVSAAPQGAPQPNNPQPNPAPVTPAPVAGAGCPGGSPNHPTSALTNICCPVSLLPVSKITSRG